MATDIPTPSVAASTFFNAVCILKPYNEDCDAFKLLPNNSPQIIQTKNQAIADARWSTVKSTYTSLFDLQLPDSPTLMDIMQHEWQDQDVDALA